MCPRVSLENCCVVGVSLQHLLTILMVDVRPQQGRESALSFSGEPFSGGFNYFTAEYGKDWAWGPGVFPQPGAVKFGENSCSSPLTQLSIPTS